MSQQLDNTANSEPNCRRREFYILRRLAAALIVLFMAGCAAQRLHEEGMDLIDQGHVEEGLVKLEAASKSEPGNFSYRIDLIHSRDRIINRLLQHADSQRAAGHYDEAAKLYQGVLQIDNKDSRAVTGLANLEMDKQHATAMLRAQKLFEQNELQEAQNIVKGILLEDPAYKDAKVLSRKIDEQLAKNAFNGPSLKPEFKKPVTLEFRDANLKMVVEALSRTSGLNILLDKDIHDNLKTTIFVNHASVEDTIDLIALQDGLYKKILSDNTILLYPNTPVKVKEYQDLMIRNFQLTNADAKEMEKMLKALLKTKDMYVDEKTNSLVIRDTPDAIQLADKLIAAQDLAQPEVMLEVEVLEVTRSKLTELGIKLPEQIALSASGTPETTTVNTLPGGGVVTTTTPSQPLTLHDVGHLTDRFFSVSPINASIDLKDESGDANILASPRIRVRNREKAKILIGDRVPVITNAITPVSSGTPVVTGNVQYLDVGLKLDVQPYIHPDDDVEIKVNLEVSSIVREISSGPTLAYQIGTRTANTVLRLKDGETQVLAGLISDEDRKAAQKFPGLGDLPIVGRLFSSHKNDAKKTEIVLSITPHLTRRNQHPNAQNLEFWSGTDGTLRSRPITLEPAHVNKHDNAHTKVKLDNADVSRTAPIPAPASPASTSPVSPTVTAPAIADKPAAAPASPKPQSENTPAPTEDKSSGVATGSQAPFVLNWHGPQQIKVGDQFQVAIAAQSSEPVRSLSFTLGYDRTALAISHIEEGNLFNQDDKKTIFTSKVNPDTGTAFVYVSRLSPQGASGQGNVAVVTFSVQSAKATSPIVISDPHLMGGSGARLPPPPTTPYNVSLVP
ncbi:MAG: type II and III secretion system protein [Gammaproteobacteria bacterium]|nr:type II and III secretion system protein [Gammaproteobacteria bacterium]